MGKKSNVLTREQREAIGLLNKITKKVQNELSEFWVANQNQFKQNKVALKEGLKKAIREDRNGDKEEMFNFFWNKIDEVKQTQKNKKNQKGFEINESFINELVVEATLCGDYRYIENLGEKIGYERLINNGKTYRVMLEAGRHDMFKELYNKCHELYKKGDMPIKVISTGIEATVEKNAKEVLDFCIGKEEGNLDTKLLGVWKEELKTLIDKGHTDVATERLNAIQKQNGIMDEKTYSEIAKSAVVNNANEIFDQCFDKVVGKEDRERAYYMDMFMLAVASDNTHVIEKVGKQIPNDVLKASLAAKIVKRENLKDIVKEDINGQAVTVRREAKESAIKTIGDYIISQDKQQVLDEKAIQERSEELFNKLEGEGNKTIDTITKVLMDNDAKNENDINDIKSNLTIAKMYAERITIGDRITLEVEKFSQRDISFREESKELRQEISNIEAIVRAEGKVNKFTKMTKELMGISDMLSKQTKKMLEKTGDKIMQEIKEVLDKTKPSKKNMKGMEHGRLKKMTSKQIKKLRKQLEANKDTIRIKKEEEPEVVKSAVLKEQEGVEKSNNGELGQSKLKKMTAKRIKELRNQLEVNKDTIRFKDAEQVKKGANEILEAQKERAKAEKIKNINDKNESQMPKKGPEPVR